jgi:thiol-disulfide isomerase/thioredoxin
MRPLGLLGILFAALLAAVLGMVASVAVVGPGPLLRSPVGPLAERWFLDRRPGAIGIGDPVPAFRLAALDAGQRTLPVQGRATLINYWASWCGPCRGEMPLLDAFSAGASGAGIQVVGVAVEDADSARGFLREYPVRFPIAVEPPAAGPDSAMRLGNHQNVLPFSVLVDAHGRVRARRYGAFSDRRDLEAWVAAAEITRN